MLVQTPREDDEVMNNVNNDGRWSVGQQEQPEENDEAGKVQCRLIDQSTYPAVDHVQVAGIGKRCTSSSKTDVSIWKSRTTALFS